MPDSRGYRAPGATPIPQTDLEILRWSEEDDELYRLPDAEVPLVYFLHYRQQCPQKWDDSSLPAETAEWQKKDEPRYSNLHDEEDLEQNVQSMNLDPRLQKLLLAY